MKRISCPCIKELDKLPDDLCILDDHVGSDPTCSEMDVLCKLLDNCNNPYILSEYPYSNELKKYNLVHIPYYWIRFSGRLRDSVPETDWANKTSAFSFMLNKVRINRRRMIELLESNNLFTKTYTLVSNKFVYEQKYFVAADTVKLEDSVVNKKYDNISTYNEYLREHVFEPSYIHLITEASWYAQSTFIDEKSVFPFEAGNIPIWVGGYGHPTYFRKMGFDVFDDLVDHSYEMLDDPVDRLQQAIMLNKNLLQNKDLLAEYFDKNRYRFEANRKLIRSTKIFDYYANTINDLAWPAEYKQDLLNTMRP